VALLAAGLLVPGLDWQDPEPSSKTGSLSLSRAKSAAGSPMGMAAAIWRSPGEFESADRLWPLPVCNAEGSKVKRLILLAAPVIVVLAGCQPQAAAFNESAGAHSDGSKHEVAVTQYLIDTAGFHAIDSELEQTGEIQAGYLGTVGRVSKLVEHTAWPAELEEPAARFQAALTALLEALEGEESAAAAEAASEAHAAQHDLSHAIDNWLSGDEAAHDKPDGDEGSDDDT